MIRIRAMMLAGAALALASCASGVRPTGLPHGTAAYDVMPPVPATEPAPIARPLQAGDTIAIQVYREPDLTVEKTVIDDLGTVQVPLLGEVAATGRTPAELARLIGDRLGARYLRNPRVTVSLLGGVAQTVSVEGQVARPGIFQVGRGETLLTALAQAGSPTQLAKHNEVVVFRKINGQRMGAVFNLDQIRAGRSADPQILDGDVVVVGYSQVKGAYRDFLMATPLLNLFTVF